MRTIQSKQRFPLPCFSDFLFLLPRYPLVVIIQSCSTDYSERARSGVLVLLAMIDIGNFRKTFPLLSFATGVVYDFTNGKAHISKYKIGEEDGMMLTLRSWSS